MSAIEFESVSKTYHKNRTPVHALNEVSFTVGRGEFFGLLGPNGAGKTSLISILAGLARADAGRVRVMGYDVRTELALAKRSLGVVPQELVFDPFFSVRETLQMQSGYFGLRRNDAWIDELLVGLGLGDKAHTNMRQLSGGMKRRVLVAQALVHRPPVIVLDEPTAGVDVELRQTLWQFIRRLNQDGATVLLTTHYLEEAEAMCQRVALLKLGQIAALQSTSSLIQRAAGQVLQVKTDSPLPASLRDQARVTGRVVQFKFSQVHEAEALLAELRQAQVVMEDIAIRKADLEDAFLQIMAESQAAPADKAH